MLIAALGSVEPQIVRVTLYDWPLRWTDRDAGPVREIDYERTCAHLMCAWDILAWECTRQSGRESVGTPAREIPWRRHTWKELSGALGELHSA